MLEVHRVLAPIDGRVMMAKPGCTEHYGVGAKLGDVVFDGVPTFANIGEQGYGMCDFAG